MLQCCGEVIFFPLLPVPLIKLLQSTNQMRGRKRHFASYFRLASEVNVAVLFQMARCVQTHCFLQPFWFRLRPPERRGSGPWGRTCAHKTGVKKKKTHNKRSILTIALLSKATWEPVVVSRETKAASFELRGDGVHQSYSPRRHQGPHVESDGDFRPAGQKGVRGAEQQFRWDKRQQTYAWGQINLTWGSRMPVRESAHPCLMENRKQIKNKSNNKQTWLMKKKKDFYSFVNLYRGLTEENTEYILDKSTQSHSQKMKIILTDN